MKKIVVIIAACLVSSCFSSAFADLNVILYNNVSPNKYNSMPLYRDDYMIYRPYYRHYHKNWGYYPTFRTGRISRNIGMYSPNRRFGGGMYIRF